MGRALLLMWVVLALALQAAAADPDDLARYKSQYYEVHTNLPRKVAAEFGRHMDATFEQYRGRFAGFRSRRRDGLRLVLLRNRDDYIAFLKHHDLDGTYTGGLFVSWRPVAGLVTWVEGRSRSDTFKMLQHEGFHQFAWNYLGNDLPVWINEGLAEYFSDAIIVNGAMKIGLANGRRTAIVKAALAADHALDFQALLNISSEQWHEHMRTDGQGVGALQYAQAWSVSHFLIHGDGGAYQPRLVRYLNLLNDGQRSERAFRLAFGTEDLTPLAARWKIYAEQLQADPVTEAVQRLNFLGLALRFLHERGEAMPPSLEALQSDLVQRNFKATQQWYGLTTQTQADERMLAYTRSNGTPGTLMLLESARDDLPPRVTAPGLVPEPTLIWRRDDEGKLIQDIEYH
jgi:hypothetical protein